MRKAFRAVPIAAMGVAAVLLAAGPASAATTDPNFNDYATTGWNTHTTTPYVLQHAGDDIGFDLHTNTHLDLRWTTCDGSSTGPIVRNFYGAGQPAELVGKNFRAGTCLYIQFRIHNGASGSSSWTGFFNGSVYYNYNIAN